MQNESTVKQIGIRVPAKLGARLEAQARREHNSVAAVVQIPASESTLRDVYASAILAALANQTFEVPEKVVARAFALADLAFRERERDR